MIKKIQMQHSIICAVILCSAINSKADLTFVTTRSSIGATDYINWGDYGYGMNAFPTEIEHLTHEGGVFEISNTIQSHPTYDPRATRFGEPTDFIEGEWTLRSTAGGPNNILRITFETPIQAVGAQLENRNANSNIGPNYSAFIEVFNGATSLGQFFSGPHTIQNLQDGSVPFVGVISDSLNITAVEFHVTSFNEFYTNTVSIVPEPASSLLIYSGFLGGLVLRRKRQ